MVTPLPAEDAGVAPVARPRGAPPAAADCERAVDKALALLPPPPRVPRREPDAGPRDPADRQRLLDECMRSTASEVACVLAAEPTSEALLACFQWDEAADAGVR